MGHDPSRHQLQPQLCYIGLDPRVMATQRDKLHDYLGTWPWTAACQCHHCAGEKFRETLQWLFSKGWYTAQAFFHDSPSLTISGPFLSIATWYQSIWVMFLTGSLGDTSNLGIITSMGEFVSVGCWRLGWKINCLILLHTFGSNQQPPAWTLGMKWSLHRPHHQISTVVQTVHHSQGFTIVHHGSQGLALRRQGCKSSPLSFVRKPDSRSP